MQNIGRIVLLFLLCNTSLLVTESSHITFSGFTEGTEYTYYTNGYNPITELTCTADYTDPIVTSLSTSWYLGSSTNTGSNLLRFEDVAEGVKWGSRLMHFCRAVINGQEQEDSASIAVSIKYNTTIVVSYKDIVHVREITNNNPVIIPIMTESVVISCDAEGGKWTYRQSTGARLTGVANPITIDLFTLEYVLRFECTKRDSLGSNRNIHKVDILAVGSGIWLQEESTYTELAEADNVVLTEDRTLVCVSSKNSLYTAWYYRGAYNTGPGERVHSELEQSKGFVKLNIPRSLPANRTGYYYCVTNEYSRDSIAVEQPKEHSVRVHLPTDAATSAPTTNIMTEATLSNPTTHAPEPTTTTTATTTKATTPSTSKANQATTPPPPPPPPTTTTTTATILPATTATASGTSEANSITTPLPTAATNPTTKEAITPQFPTTHLNFYYTTNYTEVFVGVDDITLICIVKTDSMHVFNVSLVDTETGSILKSQTGSEGDIQLEERVEVNKGDLSYKCTVDTETGQTVEQYVSIKAEDPYTQEIINLHTDTSSDGREVLLQWDTSHTLLANETFIIWIYSVNETNGYRKTGATHSTDYPLLGLSDSFHYSLRVQVVSRLSSSHTSLYYIHTERVPPVAPEYGVIGLIAGLIIVIVLFVLILVLIMILLLKRRYRQTKMVDHKSEKEPGIGSHPQYYNISEVYTSGTPPNTNQLILNTHTSKKGTYKKLPQSDIPSSPPQKDTSRITTDYISLDQLGKETDSGMEDIGSHNGELQYENVRDTVYQSTSWKYVRDPHAILVPLTQYKDHLSQLLDEYGLEKEYRALGGQELRSECNNATLNVNKNKNKYKLIYPYDKSRVVLASPHDTDYINASFIPGFYLSDTFIAAQAPKSNTVEDFWQLILEQRVSTIVMLTRLVEQSSTKCMGYWPECPGTSEEYGHVMVTLQKEEHYTEYSIRQLVLTVSDNRKIKVTQFHYTAWPDHDVPQLYSNLLEFTEIVKQHKERERAPLLVHCSAGVGRSGTFISLYNLVEAVSAGEPISVYRIVNEMREHRPQMVQTFNQYQFIYFALLELIFGRTSIPSEDFCENYKLYQQSQGDTNTDIFMEQFQELSYQSKCSFNYLQTVAMDPSNADNKNVVKEGLPYDSNRVTLYSPNWPCEYINASYMEEYELAVTPLPTSNTIQDFLQLVYQLEDPLVVVLLSKKEYQRVREGASNRVCYWLEEQGRRDFGGFSVTTEKSNKSSFLIQQKMKVFTNYDNDERSFSQFISLVWEETGGVTDVVGVLTLLEFIKQRHTPSKKLLFVCSDGIGKSGVLLSVYTAVREMDRNRPIDVFQTVKKLRNARKNMVPTIEHYLSCYHLINEYCQMNV